MTAPIELPPLDVLRTLFHYRDDGQLIWLVRPNAKVPRFSVAGGVKSNGYRCIRYHYVDYLAHRIVWAMTKDEPLPEYIGFVDGDILNMRTENLKVSEFKGTVPV